MSTRRDFLTAGAALLGGASLLRAQPARAAEPYDPEAQGPPDTRARYEAPWQESYSGGSLDVAPLAPGLPDRDYRPVAVPNGGKAPFRIVDGVKVFHLVVSEIEHTFAPGLTATCWAYNGYVAGYTIEAVEGERVRVYVTNRLRAATSVHWHGIYLPPGMDGVAGLTQRAIPPGETFRYEWTLRQHGTFMFHSHHDSMTQEAMGLTGMLVVHPRNPSPEHRVERDFSIMLGEFAIQVGTSRPDPVEDRSFNVLTFNGKAFPGTEPLVVKTRDRVRIRYGNLSAMDHHPIHLHGYHFRVTATDGAPIPLSAQWPETSVLVGVGQTRDVQFVADAPGDWIFHCHMSHHMMNQMGHDWPNMVGVDLGDLEPRLRSLLPGYMTMGTTGMEDMGDMGKMSDTGETSDTGDMEAHREHMPIPPNSIPMKGAQGPFGLITMGGLVNILKVRDRLASYDADPGWYEHPEGTVAQLAAAEELRRDGIAV